MDPPLALRINFTVHKLVTAHWRSWRVQHRHNGNSSISRPCRFYTRFSSLISGPGPFHFVSLEDISVAPFGSALVSSCSLAYCSAEASSSSIRPSILSNLLSRADAVLSPLQDRQLNLRRPHWALKELTVLVLGKPTSERLVDVRRPLIRHDSKRPTFASSVLTCCGAVVSSDWPRAAESWGGRSWSCAMARRWRTISLQDSDPDFTPILSFRKVEVCTAERDVAGTLCSPM